MTCVVPGTEIEQVRRKRWVSFNGIGGVGLLKPAANYAAGPRVAAATGGVLEVNSTGETKFPVRVAYRGRDVSE